MLFRLLILGDTAQYVVENASVGFYEEEERPVLLSQSLVEDISPVTTETVIEVTDEESLPVVDLSTTTLETVIEVDIPMGSSLSEAQRRSSEEALKYIAGYIAHKKKEFPELREDGLLEQASHCPWIDLVSYGGLTKPSQLWIDQVTEFEKVFQSLHGHDVSREKMIISNFAGVLCNFFPGLSPELLKFYAKTRIFIRIKFLRNKFKKSSEEQRNRKKAKHFAS